jgi:hypothetical protein
MRTITIKEVFHSVETINNHTGQQLVCRGKLLFPKPSILDYVVISESEPVLKGDSFLVKTQSGYHVCMFDGLERSSGCLGCYTDTLGWVYERDIKNKILCFPKDFSQDLVKQIARGELFNEQEVLISCDQNTIDGNTIKRDFKLFPVDKEVYDPKKKLPSALVKKAILELKKEHRKRYGEKMKADGSGYEPKSKSYKVDCLYDDLEFVLNHIHLP